MLWSLVMGGMLLLGADPPRAEKSPGERSRWLDDVATAQHEARRTGKLVFAVLH